MAVDYLQGLARTVYIHTVYDRIFGDFPAKKQKWRVYTVYIWSWPTLIIYNLSQGLVTIAKKLGPHDCPEKNKKGRKYKLKLRRKCSCEDRVTEKMEKLERSTDKNQEWCEWFRFASLQELEFKRYTLNSAGSAQPYRWRFERRCAFVVREWCKKSSVVKGLPMVGHTTSAGTLNTKS